MAPEFPSTRLSLLKRLGCADNEAWDDFVDRYGPSIFAFCRRKRISPEDQNDVVQEVLRRLWTALRKQQFDKNKGSFRGWLATIIRHAISTYFSDNKRKSVAAFGDLSGLPDLSELTESFHIPIAMDALEEAATQVCEETKDEDWIYFCISKELRNWLSKSQQKKVEDWPNDIQSKDLANRLGKSQAAAYMGVVTPACENQGKMRMADETGENELEHQCPDASVLKSFTEGLETSAAVTTHIERCATCLESVRQLTIDVEAEDWLDGIIRPCRVDHSAEHPLLLSLKRAGPPEVPEFPGGMATIAFPNADADAPMGRFDSFRVMERIGEGAFGIVYRAHDMELSRDVAIKFLRPELAAVEWYRKRFVREAQSASAVNSPNVVQVYSVGELETPGSVIPYIVMEYVDGQSLEQAVRHGTLTLAERVEIATHVVQALVAAHKSGLVHRDIKPSNILIDARDGNAKLADFGLARLSENTSSTLSNGIAGTLQYMSPEHIGSPENVDERSDIFSFGVVLYELLTNRRPFSGDKVSVLHAIGHAPVVSPRRHRPELPRDLETITLKCLEKDPHRRYQTATRLGSDLRLWKNDLPISARRRTAAERLWTGLKRKPILSALAVSLVATVISAGWVISQQRERQRQTEATVDQTTLKLRESEISQLIFDARQLRLSEEPGSSASSLEQIRRARGLVSSKSELIPELRDEAISALSMFDLVPARKFPHKLELGCGIDGHFRRVAFSDDHGNIRIQELLDQQPDSTLQGDGVPAWWLEFNPDGRYLAALYHQDPVSKEADQFRLWDLSKKTYVNALPDGISGEAMAFSRDGDEFYFVDRDNRLRSYSLSQHRFGVDIDVGRPANYLAVAPGKRRFAVSTKDREVRILDLDDGGGFEVLRNFSNARGLTWDAGGKLLAVGIGNDVQIWNVEASESHHLLTGHSGPVSRLKFSRDGNLLASYGWDNVVRLWEWKSGRLVVAAPGCANIRFSPDDNSLFGGWDGDSVETWRIVDHQIFRELRHDEVGSPVENIEFCPWNDLIVTSGYDGTHVWEADSVRQHIGYITRDPTISALFHANSRSLITTHQTGLCHWRWQPERSQGSSAAHVGPRGVYMPPFTVSQASETTIAAQNSLICVSIADGAGAYAIGHSGEHGPQLLDAENQVRGVALSPDGALLAASDWPAGRSTRIWNLESGKKVADLPSGSATARFSPDGRMLATGSLSRYAVWSTDTWKCLHEIARTGGARGPVAFSPDSSVLGIVTSPGEVCLISAGDRRQIARLVSPSKRNVRALCFNRDGSMLAAASEEHIIQVWDLLKLRQALSVMELDWDTRRPVVTAQDNCPAQLQVTRLPEPAIAMELPPAPFESNSASSQAFDWALVRMCYDAKNWNAAVPYLNRIIGNDTSDWRAYIYRGSSLANLGEWSDALTDFSSAINLTPQGLLLRAWHSKAVLEVSTGQIEEYHSTCSGLIDGIPRYADSADLSDLAYALRVYAIAPGATDELEYLLSVFDRPDEAGYQDDFLQDTLAAITFRVGRFEEARVRYERLLARMNRSRGAADFAFLAMIHHHLGNTDDAVGYLNDAEEWMDEHTNGRPNYWGDWREFELLVSEAKRLLRR